MITGIRGYWSRGDLNGFLGFFANILTNIMVITGLLIFSVGIPAEIVIGRILPGLGVGVAFGNFYYAFMARRLAKKLGRNDVTALPYGPAVAQLFLVTYVVIGPVYWTTGNPTLAWAAGLAWCFLEGIIEIAGAFIAKKIRSIMPRAAMLSIMAGMAISIIAMRPVAQVWGAPLIGFICLGFVLVGFFSKKKLPFGIPAAGFMIVFGTIIGWLTGAMQLSNLQIELSKISFSLPSFAFRELFTGFGTILPFLISVFPMGISNAINTLGNVESAEAAGDSFNLKEAMIFDGVGTLTGVFFGSPYCTSVYIGHPGYKSMGAKYGYSIATGIGTLIVCFFGLTPVLLTIIPIEALMPILIFIGLVIGSQAFQATPREHAPAVIIALFPWLANWVVTIINNTLQAAGTNAFAEGIIGNLRNIDIFYLGLLSISRGAIISGMMLSMLVVFLIDGKLKNATISALVLAALSFFGFIHGANLGINVATNEMFGYLMIAAIIFIVMIYNDKWVKKGDAGTPVNPE